MAHTDSYGGGLRASGSCFLALDGFLMIIQPRMMQHIVTVSKKYRKNLIVNAV